MRAIAPIITEIYLKGKFSTRMRQWPISSGDKREEREERMHGAVIPREDPTPGTPMPRKMSGMETIRTLNAR